MYRLLLLTALSTMVILAAPSASAQPSEPESAKYWVFFTDKTDAAGKTLTAEPDYVSPRALARRQRRGRAVASRLDAPLAPRYLAALRARSIEPLVESRWLNAVSAYLTPDQVEGLAKQPFVRGLRPVARGKESAQTGLSMWESVAAPMVLAGGTCPNATYGDSCTQLDIVNVIPLLEQDPPINGTGVRIGFLDTEYGDFDHPAFEELINEGRLIAVENFAQHPQNSRHGLQVMSVAVGYEPGELVGPAHGAEVLAATTEQNDINGTPSETHQEEDNLVAGLEWMERNGADVVNVSLSYTYEFEDGNDYTPADLDGDTAVTTRAADLAAQAGVVVVASAGNEGADPDWGTIGTPADGDSVIAVGGVYSTGSWVPSSGDGPTADGRIKPDVAAMGSSVYVAQVSGGYRTASGTSFASPMVAGIVAQILQVNPDLNPADVMYILHVTASQAENPNNQLGWGIANAEAAVQLAANTGSAIEDAPLPAATLRLKAPYPNPFRERAVFEIDVPNSGQHAELSIYDLLGRRVAVPFSGTLSPGTYRVVFENTDLPPGLYVYRLRGKSVQQSGTLVRLR